MNREAIQERVISALGGKYHKPVSAPRAFLARETHCICGNIGCAYDYNIDLTTWPDFGWMWEQMQKREDFASFVIFVECRFTKHENGYFKEVILNLINPEQFLLVVDVWLQGKRRI
jgi:hypothetical protein